MRIVHPAEEGRHSAVDESVAVVHTWLKRRGGDEEEVEGKSTEKGMGLPPCCERSYDDECGDRKDPLKNRL